MKTVTSKQMKKLDALYYWQMELSTELQANSPDPDYVAQCAENVGYATAECYECGIDFQITMLAKCEGAKCLRNFAWHFAVIAQQNGILVDDGDETNKNFHIIAQVDNDAILHRISDGQYILARNFNQDSYTWDAGIYFGNTLDGLARCITKAQYGSEKVRDIKLMHEVMISMNNEDAYLSWINFMPDCPSEEDFEDIANENYMEAMHVFCSILEEYGKDDLYDAPQEVFDFALKFMPTIGNIQPKPRTSKRG